jgi:hypothetical protein
MGSWRLGLQTARKRHVTYKGYINPSVNHCSFLLLLLPSLALDSCIIKDYIAPASPICGVPVCKGSRQGSRQGSRLRHAIQPRYGRAESAS